MTATHPEAPEGGYYIMVNHEQTADHCDTLTKARIRGLELCDAEPIPSSWSIYDANGQFVEDIERTDGMTLEEQIAQFNAQAARRN